LQSVFREPPGLVESLMWMAGIAAVSLWMAARSVARREYVLEQ
jgi:hypothetical protein